MAPSPWRWTSPRANLPATLTAGTGCYGGCRWCPASRRVPLGQSISGCVRGRVASPFHLYIASVGRVEMLSRVTPAILDVLQVLLASSVGGCHGFAIAKDVKRPTGSVYPILARLERV